MADDLLLLPCAGDARAHAEADGFVVTGVADGVGPTRRDIHAILAELGWTYGEEDGYEPGDWWYVFPDVTAGLSVDEMHLTERPDVPGLAFRVSFRQPSLREHWEVCRRVVLRCGPQVALLLSEDARTLLLTADAPPSYEEFHLALTGQRPSAAAVAG